ncbi:Iron hydrogenase 1 [Salinivirga cyanobacteriivorans]|uniref:Iron hydrogenase 1 n=1 Tax=Salinivirga cyanobacteriivorans TaxID=1307839 RepID=A0A0S2I1C9_9BACT|nr:[Fe-Fe] hydrogenase large subunit C-terminal domain-containing protein [Salinivirga cyanobacteriivorans]ALO16185.1 Iron hydrogenase 1 [Salinivirga cyanobacteriivorans]
MNKQEAIYTEANNCQDCYKCIRHCPVKAIKIEDHSASIMHHLCIFCGICTSVCPAEAKIIRNDIHTANYYLHQEAPVYLSLAPSFVSDFSEWPLEKFMAACKKLGFEAVSETALGAEMLSAHLKDWIPEQKNGIYISSCCPTVVELIQKYYPEHIGKLTPFVSPVQAHARLLKKLNPNARVVFAGPCISKKTELDFPDNAVDTVLTFEELSKMFDNEGLLPELVDVSVPDHFYPKQAHNGRLYPVDGGMSNSLQPDVAQTSSSFMSFSGMATVKKLLDNMPETNGQTLFLELLACDGGCINGPGRASSGEIIQSRSAVLATNQEQEGAVLANYSAIPLAMDYQFNFIEKQPTFPEDEIREVLSSIGKMTPDDELNCGGCGYNTCRNFAQAILGGKAERQMCVSYMRKMAQNKASVLLRKMPYGVVIVDENLKVIESNELFASIWGETSQLAYDARPGLEGASIEKLTPLSRLFKNLLHSGHERIEKDLEYEGRVLHVSLFTIQKHKQVCAIVRVPGEHDVSVDELLLRLKQVVRENMQTAQKAASLIGENAANTECAINTVMDSMKGGSNA